MELYGDITLEINLQKKANYRHVSTCLLDQIGFVCTNLQVSHYKVLVDPDPTYLNFGYVIVAG